MVVFTEEAFAYVSGPSAVAEVTGLEVTAEQLSGERPRPAHRCRLAGLPAERDLDDHLAWLLGHLPDNCMEPPPRAHPTDPVDRPCGTRPATTMPESKTAGYDVREIVADVLDCDSCSSSVSVRAEYGLPLSAGWTGGRWGVVANQPRAGEGPSTSRPPARRPASVSWCDAFNLPLLTFVVHTRLRAGT